MDDSETRKFFCDSSDVQVVSKVVKRLPKGVTSKMQTLLSFRRTLISCELVIMSYVDQSITGDSESTCRGAMVGKRCEQMVPKFEKRDYATAREIWNLFMILHKLGDLGNNIREQKKEQGRIYKPLKPSVVVVEEAGQVLEPHMCNVIVVLSQHARLVQIDDHMQLLATCRLFGIKANAFDRSQFE